MDLTPASPSPPSRPARARRRPVRLAVATVLALVGSAVAVTAAAIAAAPTASAALTPTRTVGGGPLDDVMYWAGVHARPNDSCGLTQQRLAAMVLTVTFSESGAAASTAPSPMTLSRWDTQSTLWAFGNPATKYQQAFFHPGVGQWQFDSAGGWPLTAAGAIDTKVSGKLAAQTMAAGYCGSSSTDVATKMRAGWRPWTYCTPVNNALCFNLFNAIFDGTNVVVKRDNSVSSTGGMEYRTCTVAGIGAVTCGYVDPAKAQGARNFAVAPTNGNPPTPISKPFYVFEANGREYRYWLKGDTGYDATVVASKPLTANARTSLTWSTVEAGAPVLCDQSSGKGCAVPFGAIDAATAGPGTLTVAGWAIDPHTANPTSVRIKVDGAVVREVVANGSRPDVGAAYPDKGAGHGYAVSLTGIAPGRREVCVEALDTAPPIIATGMLGCVTVTIAGGDPIGTIDVAQGRGRSVRVAGWVVDPDTPASANVHVSVNGRVRLGVTASGNRPDVGAAFPGYGNAHGYDVVVPDVAPGRTEVCAYAINIGPGVNPLLACRTVWVHDVQPIGFIDAVTPGPAQSLRVAGWSLDPDTDGPTDVHIYVGGTGRSVRADASRPDVAAAFPGYAASRGYDTTFTSLSPGEHPVCVYAINIAAGGNQLIGCRTVTIVDAPPLGALDLATAQPSAVRMAGWAFDPDTPASITVQLTVDGVSRVDVVAGNPRPDVGAAFSISPARGFDATIRGVAPGRRTVCAVARNVGTGPSPSLGCRTIDVPK